MKTAKFLTILSMTIIMSLPSLTSAQEFYLWADFIPGNTENAYFDDWALCWEWASGRSILAGAPAMGDKIKANESIVMSASDFKNPSFGFTLTTEIEKALPILESYNRDKRKFPMKLALCNSRGEPEGMYFLTNATVSAYEEHDNKLDLTVSFEELKFTSMPEEFEFDQQILFDVLSIDWGTDNKQYPGFVDCVCIAYKINDLPTKMDLLNTDTDKVKPITLNAEQCKDQKVIIELSKERDISTPALATYFQDKKKFPAKIAIINEGEEGAFIYELKNVMVTSYQELEFNNRYTLEFSELKFYADKN